MPNKMKISQHEFEELYEINDEGITEDTPREAAPKEDTTPEFLTEEEQQYDNNLKESLNWNEEEDK